MAKLAVPDNEAVCGVLDALSVTVSVPVRVPVVTGVNVTLIKKVDRAAMVFGACGQLDVCAKLVEVEILVMVSGTD